MRKSWKVSVLTAAMTVLVGTSAFALSVYPDYYFPTEAEMMQNYSFTLDGNHYQLPVSMQTLHEQGWSIQNFDAGQSLPGMSYGYSEIEKGQTELTVDVLNLTDGELPYEECLIGRIAVEQGQAVSFALDNGLTIGTPVSDFLQMLGLTYTPSTTKEPDEYSDQYYDLSHNGELIWYMPEDAGSVRLCLGYGDPYDQDNQLFNGNVAVGENALDVTFDRPLCDAEAEVSSIDIELLDYPKETASEQPSGTQQSETEAAQPSGTAEPQTGAAGFSAAAILALIEGGVDQNRTAIDLLLAQAVDSLEVSNPAAAEVLRSAQTLVESGNADAAALTALIEAAVNTP